MFLTQIFDIWFKLKISQDLKREREDIPENNIASLQEELAASKLREAESNLALKDLRSKVSDLNTMWQKHLKVNQPYTFNISQIEAGDRKLYNERKQFLFWDKKWLWWLVENKYCLMRRWD